jgi:hypothetical protein
MFADLIWRIGHSEKGRYRLIIEMQLACNCLSHEVDVAILKFRV